jgi:hypothetical protein
MQNANMELLEQLAKTVAAALQKGDPGQVCDVLVIRSLDSVTWLIISSVLNSICRSVQF